MRFDEQGPFAVGGVGQPGQIFAAEFLIFVDDELEKEKREKGRKSERSEPKRTKKKRERGRRRATPFR